MPRTQAAREKNLLNAAVYGENREMDVVEVEDAYHFIDRMTAKGNRRVAEAVKSLIEGKNVRHLRDSMSEKTHKVELSIPFTFAQLLNPNARYTDKLGKALKNSLQYDGPNQRGYICEVVALAYGHNAQNDIDMSLDVCNQIAVLAASITAGSPTQANAELLQQIHSGTANQLRVSYTASSKQTPAQPFQTNSGASSSLADVENEMRRQISEETAKRGTFTLAHPEVLQYDSPHVSKVYDAFAGITKDSLLKGVVVVDTKNDYKYVVETSALSPAIKHLPDTRFVYRGSPDSFEAGSIHVFRVHKDVLSKIVDTVTANAKEVEKLARRIEDINCTLVSHLQWERRGEHFYSPLHKVSVPKNQPFCFNVHLEIKARYYNEPNCFASDPLNVGIWFNPVFRREDVVYETGSVINEAKPIYDPSNKAVSEMIKEVSVPNQTQNSNNDELAAASSSSSAVTDD